MRRRTHSSPKTCPGTAPVTNLNNQVDSSVIKGTLSSPSIVQVLPPAIVQCNPAARSRQAFVYAASLFAVIDRSSRLRFRTRQESLSCSLESRSKNGKGAIPSNPGNAKLSNGTEAGASLLGIAQRIAAARNKLKQVSEEVQALEASPEGFVVGSEISDYYTGSSSVIQDLNIPETPYYWGMLPDDTLHALDSYLSEVQCPEEERSAVLENCTDLLAKLRGWALHIADKARPLLENRTGEPSPRTYAKELDALVTLLQASGFAILPDLPEVTDPPSPDVLPLGNSIEETLDPTILRGSKAIHDHIEVNGVCVGSPTYYPYLFIATRGVSLARKSGLLLPQKMRAIERSYFSWIRTPFAVLLKPFQLLVDMTRNTVKDPLAPQDSSSAAIFPGKESVGEQPSSGKGGFARTQQLESSVGQPKKIRRVVPALKLEGIKPALASFFLPTFTQEPAHELFFLMYKEVIPDKIPIRREKRTALLRQIKDSVTQAINPIPPNRREAERSRSNKQHAMFEDFRKPLGEDKSMTMRLFAEVPWGIVSHFLPSTFILPATRDLLRIDALTSLGLVSTFITYVRNADSVFIFALLMGSILSYSVRVGFGWRQALTAYKGKIACDRADRLLSRQKSCLDVLANLAAEEMFIEAVCIFLSETIMMGITPQVLQKNVFQRVSLTDESVRAWKDWMQNNRVLKV